MNIDHKSLKNNEQLRKSKQNQISKDFNTGFQQKKWLHNHQREEEQNKTTIQTFKSIGLILFFMILIAALMYIILAW
ncbi:MAG: hypothetical protein ACPG4Z_05695 [Chitinophagales bacterium]